MYLVTVYDYDAAPDARCYYVYERKRIANKADAIHYARYKYREELFVGARVVDEETQEEVCGCGLIPSCDYRASS